MATRHLIPVFGDQLSRDSRLFEIADPEQDVFVMAEVKAEIERYRNHRQRVILFLSAMRHFRNDVEEMGFRVEYTQFDDAEAPNDLISAIRSAASEHSPSSLLLLEPGRFDLENAVRDLARELSLDCRILDDSHFFCTRDEFRDWAKDRSAMVMEHFYRRMRRKTGYLMDGDDPEGGEWNYDSSNRKSFGNEGPQGVAQPEENADRITKEVAASLEEQFPNMPGSAMPFVWPVTPDDARNALNRFIENHLASFGPTQDAMWGGEAFLHHSLLSSALNLKLLDPRTAIEAAIDAYAGGRVPIESVEGFVRQILGWREFMRGIYWLRPETLQSANFFGADNDLPDFYWSAETDLACLREVVRQLQTTAYAHHIQRLMVAGLFSLLYGVEPRQTHEWFMAMYIDSVEWVTLPNTLGMSQFADGGVVATKPYIASGKYINRMSNYCSQCRFNPNEASGSNACPFTTLYWDFIRRHEAYLTSNGRTKLQVRNYSRKSPGEKAAITRRANEIREQIQQGAI